MSTITVTETPISATQPKSAIERRRAELRAQFEATFEPLQAARKAATECQERVDHLKRRFTEANGLGLQFSREMEDLERETQASMLNSKGALDPKRLHRLREAKGDSEQISRLIGRIVGEFLPAAQRALLEAQADVYEAESARWNAKAEQQRLERDLVVGLLSRVDGRATVVDDGLTAELQKKASEAAVAALVIREKLKENQ